MAGATSCCFLCNNDLVTDSLPPTLYPKRESGEWKCHLSDNVEVVFLLRKLLEVPQEQIVNLLIHSWGDHPSEWDFAKCCNYCRSSVLRGQEVYQNILGLCKELRKIKQDVVGTAKNSWRRQGFGVRIRNKYDPGVTSLRDDLVTDLKDFVCEHDYRGNGILSGFFLNVDQLLNDPISILPQQQSLSELLKVEMLESPVHQDWQSFVKLEVEEEEEPDDDPIDWMEDVDPQVEESNSQFLHVSSSERIKPTDPRPRKRKSKTDTTKRKYVWRAPDTNTTWQNPRKLTKEERTCPDCKHTYSSGSGLNAHLRLFASRGTSCRPQAIIIKNESADQSGDKIVDGRKNTCPDCGCTFGNSKSLGKHLKLWAGRTQSCREQRLTNPTQSPRLICSSCGGTFWKHKILLNHVDSTGRACHHVPLPPVPIKHVKREDRRRPSTIQRAAPRHPRNTRRPSRFLEGNLPEDEQLALSWCEKFGVIGNQQNSDLGQQADIIHDILEGGPSRLDS